ncbi:PmbA/TldA family metallopeptidase, partial [Pradoshia sp.]
MKPQIAQLGYVALESSDIEKSVAFFQKIIGLELTEKVGEQYYFRAWGDFQHHTLSISPGPKGRVKHISFRTKRSEDVDLFAKQLRGKGYEIDIDSSVSAGAEALKDEISAVSYSRTDSMTVRCVKNGKSGYASSELVTPEAAAELVRRACENALVVDDEDEVPLFP